MPNGRLPESVQLVQIPAQLQNRGGLGVGGQVGRALEVEQGLVCLL